MGSGRTQRFSGRPASCGPITSGRTCFRWQSRIGISLPRYPMKYTLLSIRELPVPLTNNVVQASHAHNPQPHPGRRPRRRMSLGLGRGGQGRAAGYGRQRFAGCGGYVRVLGQGAAGGLGFAAGSGVRAALAGAACSPPNDQAHRRQWSVAELPSECSALLGQFGYLYSLCNKQYVFMTYTAVLYIECALSRMKSSYPTLFLHQAFCR